MEYSFDEFKSIIINNSDGLPNCFYDLDYVLNDPINILMNINMKLKSYSYGALIYSNKFIYNGIPFKITIELKPNVCHAYYNNETIISIYNKASNNTYYKNSFKIVIDNSNNPE